MSDSGPSLSAGTGILEHTSEHNDSSTGSFMQPVYARLYRGTVWSVVGTAISQGAIVAGGIITARLVGHQAFGSFGIVQSTAGMLGTLAGLGLAMSATKYVGELRESDAVRAGRIVALTLVMAVVSGVLAGLALFVFAPVLANYALNAPQLTAELRIASALLLASTIHGAQIGTLTGLEAFRALAGVNAIRGILSLFVGAISAWQWGLTGAVGALGVCASVGCCLNQFALNRVCREAGLPVCMRRAWRERPILSQFSLPAWLSGVMVSPVNWAACAILVNRPDGYTQMALFNAANQWRNSALFFSAVVAQPLLPIFAELWRRHPAKFRHLLSASLVTMSGLSTVVAAGICLGAPRIMSLYGAGFRDSWAVLCILTISTVPAACCGVVGQVMAGCGKLWPGFGMNLAWAVALIGCTLLARQSGATGLAITFLISYGLHAGIVTLYTLNLLKEKRLHARA